MAIDDLILSWVTLHSSLCFSSKSCVISRLPVQTMTLESPHQQSGRITRSSSSASSWSRYTDSMKAYVRRRRLWLSLLGVVVLIGVIVGVVLTSHYYFHLFGGQGYMRRRRRWPDSDNVCLASKADLFLPMRPTSRITYAPNRAERTVPFDGCGDQMNSCEAFDQPVRLRDATIIFLERKRLKPNTGDLLSSHNGLSTYEIHNIRNILLQRHRSGL